MDKMITQRRAPNIKDAVSRNPNANTLEARSYKKQGLQFWNIAKRKYQKYFKNWDQIAFQFYLTVLMIIIIGMIIIIYLDIVSYSERNYLVYLRSILQSMIGGPAYSEKLSTKITEMLFFLHHQYKNFKILVTQ